MKARFDAYNDIRRNLVTLDQEGYVGENKDNSGGLSARQQCLLSLARLLTGSNTCCTIYEDPRQRLLISNNDGAPSHTTNIMRILGELRRGGNPGDVAANLKSVFTGDSSEGPNPFAAYLSPQMKAVERSRASKFASQAVATSSSPAPASDSAMRAQTSELDADIAVIIEGFKPGGVCSDISDYAFIVGDDGRDSVHAEMRLMPYAMQDAQSDRSYQPFIITNKLLCGTCHCAMKKTSEESKINVQTLGTHGTFYPGWTAPGVAPDEVVFGVRDELRVAVEISKQQKQSEQDKHPESPRYFTLPPKQRLAMVAATAAPTQKASPAPSAPSQNDDDFVSAAAATGRKKRQHEKQVIHKVALREDAALWGRSTPPQFTSLNLGRASVSSPAPVQGPLPQVAKPAPSATATPQPSPLQPQPAQSSQNPWGIRQQATQVTAAAADPGQVGAQLLPPQPLPPQPLLQPARPGVALRQTFGDAAQESEVV